MKNTIMILLGLAFWTALPKSSMGQENLMITLHESGGQPQMNPDSAITIKKELRVLIVGLKDGQAFTLSFGDQLSFTPKDSGFDIPVFPGVSFMIRQNGEVVFPLNGTGSELIAGKLMAKKFKIGIVVQSGGIQSVETPEITIADPSSSPEKELGAAGIPDSLTYKNSKELRPFQDAVNLHHFITAGKPDIGRQILQKYLNEIPSDAREKFKKYPPFSSLLNKTVVYAGKEKNASILLGQMEASASNTGGIMSPTIIIDAFAKLVAKRFKEELNIAYLNRFRQIVEDSIPELGQLLPQTTLVLATNDPINYKAFIPALREGFHEDASSIIDNLPAFLDVIKEKGQIKGDTTEKVFAYLRAAAFLAANVERMPADIIEDLTRQDFLTDFPSEIQQVITIANIFSQNLRANGGRSGWVEWKELTKLREGNIFQLFLGLLMIKEDSIMQSSFGANYLDKVKTNWHPFFQIYENIEKIQAKVDNINEKIKRKEELDLATFNSYLEDVLSIIEGGYRITQLLKSGDTSSQLSPELTIYVALIKSLLAISQELVDKNYAKAIVNMISILEKTLGKKHKTTLAFARYGNLMIAMMQAKDSDEALAALEAVALPVGSYRIKRSHPFDISLNAYAGGMGAFEKFRGAEFNQFLENNPEKDIQDLEDPQFVFGFSAPVGLAFSWGNNQNEKDQRSSFTAFAQLVDIGAVVSFRIQDQTSLLPEVSFKNIFAPGIYGIYGIRNSPIAIGFGLQYGPELRKITAESANLGAKAIRYGLFLDVDIPVFRIFTKKKRAMKNKLKPYKEN